MHLGRVLVALLSKQNRQSSGGFRRLGSNAPQHSQRHYGRWGSADYQGDRKFYNQNANKFGMKCDVLIDQGAFERIAGRMQLSQFALLEGSVTPPALDAGPPCLSQFQAPYSDVADWRLPLAAVHGLATTVSLASIAVSIALVYSQPQDDWLLLLGLTVSTFILVALVLTEFKLAHQSEGEARTPRRLAWIASILLTLPHPNIYTVQANPYLHLWLVLRLHFPVQYYIGSRMRARLTNISGMYGLSSSTPMFILKGLKHHCRMANIIFFYLVVILLLSHALYLSQLPSATLAFLDCLTIVYTTLATVGYGGFTTQNIFESGCLVSAVFIGLLMNALLILTSLSTFFMTSAEHNSHTLLMSLQARESWNAAAAKRIAAEIGGVGVAHSQRIRHILREQLKVSRRQYKVARGGTNRLGIVENLLSDFRTNLQRLSYRQQIAGSLVRRATTTLRRAIRRHPKPCILIEQPA